MINEVIKVKVYVVDIYEKYMRQGNEKSIHWINSMPYCIREVEMDWGVPQLESARID